MILSLGIVDIISTGQSDIGIEFAFLTALLPHNCVFCRTFATQFAFFATLLAFFTALSSHILNIFTTLALHNLVLLPSAVPHYSAIIIALKSCPWTKWTFRTKQNFVRKVVRFVRNVRFVWNWTKRTFRTTFRTRWTKRKLVCLFCPKPDKTDISD